MHVLQHEAEQSAHVGEIQFADVDAVDRNAAARDVVEPQQQIDQRRLAGPGGADNADALARPNLEADVPQHEVVVVVRKPDMVEDDVRPAGAGRRAGAAGDSTATGSSSSLKIRSDEAIAACSMLNFSDMSLIGRKKRCEVLKERDQRAEGQRLVQHVAAAVPDDQRRRQRADGLDRRVEHGVVEDLSRCSRRGACDRSRRTARSSAPRGGTAAPSTCR